MSAKNKKHQHQNSGGEAKKASDERFASQDSQSALEDAKDHKRGNIGPSGQGSHRGRERRNKQSKASNRPNVSSIGDHYQAPQ